MASCPREMLDDLASVLAEVRGWAGVIERKPGVFYAGRDPLLHFHLLRDGRRRADIKGRGDWVEVDLPIPVSVADLRKLLRQARAGYAEKGR